MIHFKTNFLKCSDSFFNLVDFEIHAWPNEIIHSFEI